MPRLKVLCWSEYTEPREVYPSGIHGAIADALNRADGIEARTSQISDPEQGVTEQNLAACDVLVWFGHSKHADVLDELAERVVRHVRERGMGFVAVHSSIHAKPFRLLMGTTCDIAGWREEGEPEQITFINPDHPIAEGMNDFVIPHTEMYKEPFDIPEPQAVVFRSSWPDGEWFRSGCCFTRGQGRVFYFRPGHETYPIFFQPEVQRLLVNVVEWAGKRR